MIYILEINKIYNEDCIGDKGMCLIPNKSIDMILCDLPYGTTACKWDIVIPFDPLWEQYERVIKDNGAICLFGSQPFTTDLIDSNRKLYRYELIWKKSRASNFMQSKKQPLKYHENIEVFYKKQPIYNPIMVKGNKNHNSKDSKAKNNILGIEEIIYNINTSDLHYPSSLLDIKSTDSTQNVHPTQKPVALCEWLIKTYTNEGGLVLDNCMGSGSTAIACININRNYIGFELEANYCDIINKRIQDIVCSKG